jgi:regulator of RNase E activity RraA
MDNSDELVNSEDSTVEVAGSGAQRVNLPEVGTNFTRADPKLLSAFDQVGAATAAATLHRMGITRAFVRGPRALDPDAKVVGSALTLKFMPMREDVAASRGQEQFEKRTALWAVLDEVEPFDVLVIQAFGDPYTGCIGEMLVNYLSTRGGLGVVVDGCIRDWPKIRKMSIPVWATGVTPNYATQAGLLPWGYHVPIACGGVLVLPGDVVLADADGAVVVPAQLAPEVARIATVHEDWELFSRERLDAGGTLKKYYPLDEEATVEYEAWQQQRGAERP